MIKIKSVRAEINPSFVNLLKDLFLFIYCLFFGVKSSPNISREIRENSNFPNFSKYYQEHIAPKNLALEEGRIKKLKKIMLISRAGFISVLTIIVALINYPTKSINAENIELFFHLVLLLSSIAIIWLIKIISAHDLQIKSTLFDKIFYFFNFHYNASGSENIAAYEKFSILPKYDSNLSKTEDLVIGFYKNVKFSLEEIDLRVRSQKNESRQIFRGIVIKLNFNKNFLGKTIVKKDIGIGNFSRKFNSNLSNLERVLLEDIEFEELFAVYSSNQIEARYLLTTSFMERLKKLNSFFKAMSLEASFVDNFLLLSFETSLNLFEVKSIFYEINLADETEKTLKEISLIYDLIDELKLNQKFN